MSFWTAVVVIVAIIAVALMRIEKYRALGHRRGRGDGPGGPSQRPSAELEHEVVELKKRLAVLERIATDDRQSRAIAQEIEALRDR